MKGQRALDRAIVLKCGPASTARRVHLVIAFPRPLGGGLPIPFVQLVMNPAVGVPKLKFTRTTLIETNVTLDFGIHEILVPHLHVRNPPETENGLGF